LAAVMGEIPARPDWPEHHSLDAAMTTERKLWPAATLKKLGPILGRFA
jgi:hypothetical protein